MSTTIPLIFFLMLQEENLKLLTVATQVPGARWAWLKLGLHFLSVRDPVEAVSSLRVAVRLNSDDKSVRFSCKNGRKS